MTQIFPHPSGNFGYPRGHKGRNGQNIVAICDHIMQGTMAGYHAVIANSEKNAANFSVSLEGRIEQHVDVENAAWCNGPMNNPDTGVVFIKKCWDQHINPNLLTISIEHEGKWDVKMPEAQYQATLSLHKKLLADHHLPADRQHIVGHYQIDGVNKVHCPGIGFPWSRLMADLNPGADPWEGIGNGIKEYCLQHGLALPDHKLWHGWDQDGDEVVKLLDGKIVYFNKRTGHITLL